MKNKIVLFLMAIVLAVGCTSEQAPYIVTTSATKMDFDANGGIKTISLDTNNDWQTSVSDSWIQISPTKGNSGNYSISVTVGENTSFEERSGFILIESGGLSTRFEITQTAK